MKFIQVINNKKERMYKKLLVSAMLILCFVKFSGAQTAKTAIARSEAYQYYIYVSGINSKADVEALETKIQKKPGVTYFLGNRYPVRYFLLKSPKEVSKATFSGWIGNRFKVEYYAEGEFSKEDALMTGINLRKKSLKTQ